MTVGPRRRRWRRPLLHFYAIALLVWVAALIVRLILWGRPDSAMSVVTIALSGLVLAIGLIATWRDGRSGCTDA